MIAWYWLIVIVYVSVWITLLVAKKIVDGSVTMIEVLDIALWPIGVPYRILRSYLIR